MIKIKLLTETAVVPFRDTPEEAGLDICSDISFTLQPQERKLVSTGVAMQTPTGTFTKIEPRSKLANKYGIQILGGVVDSSYRGEVMVIMFNSGDKPLAISVGDAIAQLVTRNIIIETPVVVAELTSSERGEKGVNCSDLRLKHK